MKRISFLMIALLMTIGMAMAQDVQRGQRKQIDPKARAEKRTERMVTEYGLNDAQKAKLLELNVAMAEKMGDRPGPRHHKKHDMRKEGPRKENAQKPEVNKEDREKRMAEMKQQHENYQSQLKEIFTAEQYQKFEANQTKRQEKMKEAQKNRKDKRDRKDWKDKRDNEKKV
ncbi:DUF4890 domain-containing protein [Bacteroides sp. 519]|uniref:DUF4890 domain-containing protein n=1 Tax=Bacteroides sp. 519 TaxID=2302937 RepID=UPI0013D1B4B6|nr:DUF4890 domain-containing protein [Bacteroides sp. 519]NDV60746.1 DUF4890 domain-containing protein [Bacteroides sp. 519]